MRSLLLFLLVAPVWAAPQVSKIEPPNWWVRHTWNPLQVLLTGQDLSGVTVTASTPFLQAGIRQTSDDGKYLFLNVRIAPNAQPGQYEFRLTKAGTTTRVPFPLLAPERTTGKWQGFSENDVIYLLMPDRFANGDAGNDSPAQFNLPANRQNIDAYHGGDFAGIRQHLGYLKDLGVTGFWMLPTYFNSSRESMPPHGYHAVDFYGTEPRFGTLADYQQLVVEAHRLGLRVMQDQVVNHTGPHHPWLQAPPTKTWFHGLDRQPRLRNDFRIEKLADPYATPSERMLPLEGWFVGLLPDLNQEDPLVADYLIQNSLWWIGMTGVDGIRMDTYPYVDRPFWEKWQTAIDRQFPNYFVVGEITTNEPATLAFFEGGVRRQGVDTKLPSMLDFPLLRALRQVFIESGPLSDLRRVLAQDSVYQHPERLVTFLGNHDMPRFLPLANGDVRRLLMAQAFLLTTRGIPHLYYGDELAMPRQTRGTAEDYRVDFPGGFAGDPVNAFTASGRTGDSATIWNDLHALLQYRRDHAALRGGKTAYLLSTPQQLAYVRSNREECVIVLLNRENPKDIAVPVEGVVASDGAVFTSWKQGELRLAGGKLSVPNAGAVEIFASRQCGVRVP